MTRVEIKSGSVTVQAELNDSACAAKILDALPLTATASTWGDEIYFDIGVPFKLAQSARDRMEVGEIAYWPPGKALCLFFGPTPVSDADGKPRAASPVIPVGRILGSPQLLKSVQDGDQITVGRAE
jgi:hypothetical protein